MGVKVRKGKNEYGETNSRGVLLATHQAVYFIGKQMSETSGILRTVLERLEWAQNQHLCWHVRTNSGKLFLPYTNKRGVTKWRAIKLCPEGTPDGFVFQLASKVDHTSKVTTIETKLKDGKLSDAQQEVKALLEEQGITHLTVRDIEQVEALWE